MTVALLRFTKHALYDYDLCSPKLVSPAKQVRRTKQYQRHCLRLIYPNHKISASRLDTAGLATVSVQLKNQCHRCTKRIHSDTTHALHNYIHTGGRVSSRRGRFIPARTRTSLSSKILFRHY